MPVSSHGTHYDVSGPIGAPAVFLIHGLGLTADATWKEIAPELASEFRVVSYDLCGHGKTALPSSRPTLSLLSEQLVSLMDELGIAQAALVGFSLGGMINRRVAIDYPNRVSALAILNSPHERGEAQQRLVEERALATAEGGPAATIDATLERWFTEGFRGNNSDAVEHIRDVVLANDHENYARHRQVLAAGVPELIRPVPAVPIPTLVMTCEHDSGSSPEMAQAISDEIPDSRLIIVPQLQHLGLIEDPQSFTAPLMAFLRDRLL